MTASAGLRRAISAAISERTGSGFVQTLILVALVALGGAAGYRALSGAVADSAECAASAIATMTPGSRRCEAGASGSVPAGVPSEGEASEVSNFVSRQPAAEPRADSSDDDSEDYSARPAPDVVIESQEWAAVTDYIAGEVERNIDSDEVEDIREFNDPRGHVVCFPLRRCVEFDNPFADAAGKRRAYEAWADLVGPGRQWDHKPAILDAYGEWTPVPGEDGYISFDVWSNIHYGLVGRHAGFSAFELHLGANAADILSPQRRTNQGDQTAVQIGIDLYEEYGEDVTAEQIRDAVIDHYDELGDEGKVYGDPDYDTEH
jgi:hypothetical protein